MKYTAVSLYRKMMDCALKEGVAMAYLNAFKTPYKDLEAVKAVPAEEFFELHERLDDTLGPGFSIGVGQQMKIGTTGFWDFRGALVPTWGKSLSARNGILRCCPTPMFLRWRREIPFLSSIY